MQAQKASDSPRRYKRGAGAGLKNRLRSLWPRVGTASPPKPNNIAIPHLATYKGGRTQLSTSHSHLDRIPLPPPNQNCAHRSERNCHVTAVDRHIRQRSVL